MSLATYIQQSSLRSSRDGALLQPSARLSLRRCLQNPAAPPSHICHHDGVSTAASLCVPWLHKLARDWVHVTLHCASTTSSA